MGYHLVLHSKSAPDLYIIIIHLVITIFMLIMVKVLLFQTRMLLWKKR